MIHSNYEKAFAQPILKARQKRLKHSTLLFLSGIESNELLGEQHRLKKLRGLKERLNSVLPQMNLPLIHEVLCNEMAIQ